MKPVVYVNLLISIVLIALVAMQWGPSARDEPELAQYMGELQRFSHKLGFCIRAQNAPLAHFYLEEIEEILEVIQEEVPEHAGMLIAQPARTIMTKLVEGLESDITKREWPAAENGYRALIDGCNRCHSATEYGFIQIDPDGSGPFNQKF